MFYIIVVIDLKHCIAWCLIDPGDKFCGDGCFENFLAHIVLMKNSKIKDREVNVSFLQKLEIKSTLF